MRWKEKLTVITPSIRRHVLQLQLPKQTGQEEAISSSDILGYLEEIKLKIYKDDIMRAQIVKIQHRKLNPK